MQSVRLLISGALAVGAMGASAAAQQPVRARSEISIPIKKNTTPAAPPAPREIAGTKTEVIGSPVVVHLIRNEAGTPVTVAMRAPTAQGGPAVPWIPLFGLLGGAVLLHGLDHDHGSTPTPPPPVIPPDTGHVTPPPPPPPPTTVPEPATIALFGTGLLALAMVRRRHSKG
jgi:hypothetical protein